MVTATLVANRALAVAVATQDLVAAHEHHGGVEARAATLVGDIGHQALELVVVGVVVAVLAGPARREDPRRAVECVNAEPGVIGDGHGEARLGYCRPRLDEGVLKEIGTVLNRIRIIPKLTQGNKAHVGEGLRENRLNLGHLVGVTRSHHYGSLLIKCLDVD